MKQLFTILTFFLTTISYSQKVGDIDNFYSGKIINDSSFKYFLSFLNKFESTNIGCEKAAERIGDYYKLKKDYLKAIAYHLTSLRLRMKKMKLLYKFGCFIVIEFVY